MVNLNLFDIFPTAVSGMVNSFYGVMFSLGCATTLVFNRKNFFKMDQKAFYSILVVTVLLGALLAYFAHKKR